MPFDATFCYGRRLRTVVSLALSVLLLSVISWGQEDQTPKYELFTGYQWLNPGGKSPALTSTYNSPVEQSLPSMPKGLGLSLTYNFTQHLGLEGELGRNWTDGTDETTGSVGPHLEYRKDRINYYLHTMLSWNLLTPPHLSPRNGIGVILGGGIDIQATRLIGIRLIGADWVFARQNFSDVVAPQFPDSRRVSLSGARISAGIVWNFGYPSIETPAATCSVQPSEVMVGEPVTATANTSNFNPKHTLTYSWSSTGGKITGKDSTASIDTNGVAGGSYTVTANITDPKMKKGGQATCTANFAVKEPPKNPPTMSCSASPTSVQAGGTVNITCSCSSPDNQPVTVSNWNATGGSISGSGSSATLNTTGASAGTITVSAACADPRGLSTQASTQVTVENPPPPPPPQASKLSECDFANSAKIGKPWRVDNECKGILDDVAKNLQQNADNKLVIVGNAEPTEKRRNLAAERAVNAKAYLTSGEAKLGIDPSRIETRTSSAGSKTEFWIVPAGGTFTGEGTQMVDESSVKPVPDNPHATARKKAKAQQ